MKLLLKSLLSVSILFLIAVFVSGCVNLDQKTVLKSDGSGTMKIKYWTKSSNVTGDELSGFGFTAEKVKANYTAGNSEPSAIVIKKNETTDSLSEVSLELKFKDLNKLSEAKAFAKVKASWIQGKDGMDFKYILLNDSANAKNMGMSDYKLTYEFEFPGEIITTNGTKDGQKVKWNKTVADLVTDVELTATVKSSKKCGLFGLELPIIFLFGMGFIYLRRKK
ncbi:MAG: hypothetical protein PHN88_11995 [Ignavibacteria bacterium]|nr:hypothetical protein [Ignavibacteria bacterium]